MKDGLIWGGGLYTIKENLHRDRSMRGRFYLYTDTTMLETIKEQAKEFGQKILWWILLAVLAVGGYMGYNWFQKDKAIIDNPSAQEINFQIDGKSYTLAANTTQEISLKDGEHKLTIDNQEFPFNKGEERKEMVLDGLLAPNKVAIINPTRADYVLAYQMYGNGPDSARPDDEEITGKVFFEVDVTYGLDEKLPDTATVRKGQRYTVIRKLYRMADYIAEYGEYLEE